MSRTLFFLLIITLISCAPKKSKPLRFKLDNTIHEKPGSIRALSVLNDSTLWWAGSGGHYGYTNDGGKTWNDGQITIGEFQPEWRSIAVLSDQVLLLNAGSPAYLLSTSDMGQSWDTLMVDERPEIFFDSMAFWDDQEGLIMGDPIDSCLTVMITHDAGRSWELLDCDVVPHTIEGEAAFAASNGNISVAGDHAWIFSGGMRAKVYHTGDRGKNWEVLHPTFIHGEPMTGIFSGHFMDEKIGVIWGGNWEDQESNEQNRAMTYDGGKTWFSPGDMFSPGYRSSVRFFPGSNPNRFVVTGSKGVESTDDGGKNWFQITNEGFYTIRFSPSGNIAWLAGQGKIGSITPYQEN